MSETSTISLSDSAGDNFNNEAVDVRHGRIFLPDFLNGRVVVYTTAGKRVGQTPVLVAANHTSYVGSAAVDDASGLAYVVIGGDTSQVVVLRGNSVVARVKADLHLYPSSSIAVNQHTGDVYVSDDGSPRVDIIRGEKRIASVTVGKYPGTLVMDDGSDYEYTLNSPNDGSADTVKGSVTVLKGTRVVRTVAIPQNDPFVGAVDSKTHDLFIGDGSHPTVSVLRRTKVVTRRLRLGNAGTPVAVTVDSRNGRAYIGTDEGVVAVSTKRVLYENTVKYSLDGIADDPRSGLLVVASDHSTDDESYGLIDVFDGTKHVEHLKGTSSGVDQLFDDSHTGRIFGLNRLSDLLFIFQAPKPAKITVTRPAGSYRKGQRVTADYTCRAGLNNAVTSCRGTTGNGKSVDTGTAGKHTFVVRAHSTYGVVARQVETYTVR